MHIRRYCIKCYLWRKLKRFSTDAIKSSYKEAEKKYRVAVDDFVKETQLLERNNLEAFFKYVNNRIVSKSGICSE